LAALFYFANRPLSYHYLRLNPGQAAENPKLSPNDPLRVLIDEHIDAHHDEIDTTRDMVTQETSPDANNDINTSSMDPNGERGRTTPQLDNTNTTDIV